MPRYPRQPSPTAVYHFINRGVNKKHIFHSEEDYDCYKRLLFEYARKFGVEIYHYCLMANHTHMLLKADEVESLSRFAHYVQRKYAYYYCKTYRWSEQVFRKRFISIPVEDDRYLLECGRYVERNPLTAHLVKSVGEYAYSSYHFYGEGRPDTLLTPSPAYLGMAGRELDRVAMYRFYVTQDREVEKEEIDPF